MANHETFFPKENFRYETNLLPWRTQHDRFLGAYIEYVLNNLNGNMKATSQALGMNRAHLYKLVAKLNVKRVKSKACLDVSEEDLSDFEEEFTDVR